MNSGSLGSKKGASLHKVAGGTCMLLMILCSEVVSDEYKTFYLICIFMKSKPLIFDSSRAGGSKE